MIGETSYDARQRLKPTKKAKVARQPLQMSAPRAHLDGAGDDCEAP